MNILKIEHDNSLFAIVIRSSYKSQGIEFFTPQDYSQQLGYMNRAKGYQIQPHKHLPVERKIDFTNEVLFIKSGRVRVDFYSESKDYLESVILSIGDIILLAHGGHGFEMLEDTEMIEVKQGPYSVNADKERFDISASFIPKLSKE